MRTTGVKPIALSQVCNTNPCETFSWYVGSFPTCPSYNACTFLPIKVFRTVKCLSSLGGFVADSFCSLPKPINTKICQGVDTTGCA